MSKQVQINVTNYKDGTVYRYKNKRVVIYSEDIENKITAIDMIRLMVIKSDKQRLELEKINGPESLVQMRLHSKYAIISTTLCISHPTLECLHHGIGEILKLYSNG